MQSSFFSMILRMKYIDRWGLMRSTVQESLSEHTMDVAVIAHALAAIARVRLHEDVNAERAALLALYHDASEIITGDMPTPVKYHNPQMTAAYKQVEEEANRTLYTLLPEDLLKEYKSLFYQDPADRRLWEIVKAADKISALIKCVEEEKSGNREFLQAKRTLLDSVNALKMVEVMIFMEEFFEPFAKTLDETV